MTPDEVRKCPECGSTDKGTRSEISPPAEGNPFGTYCKNAWHHVPPDPPDPLDFTPQELTVILALSLGMRHHDIEQHLGMTEDIVQHCRTSISDKAVGLSDRLSLCEFIKNALNAELRRRRRLKSKRREKP